MISIRKLARHPRLKPLALTILVVLALLSLPDSAAAKGPESVTLSGPGFDEPLQLLDDGNWSTVSRLMEQTGLWYATGDLPRPVAEPSGNLGPAYTLTWINMGPPHKTPEERTFYQLLYPYAENGPLIHTPRQPGLANWGSGVFGWFAAPADMVDTLQQLGAPLPATPPANLTAILPLLLLVAAILIAFLGIRFWRKASTPSHPSPQPAK